MSFINDWRVMVKENICEVCRNDLNSSDEYQEKYKNMREKYKGDNDGYWKENKRLSVELYNRGKSICFVFIADCGGDSISLCKKHLQEIIKKIDEYD